MLSRGGIFFDVRQEVADDLSQGVGVEEARLSGGEIGLDGDIFSLERGAEAVDDFGDDFVSEGPFFVQFEAVFFLARKGENIGDEAGESFDLFRDDGEALASLGGIALERFLSEVDIECEVGEGASELVRDPIDEGDSLSRETKGLSLMPV